MQILAFSTQRRHAPVRFLSQKHDVIVHALADEKPPRSRAFCLKNTVQNAAYVMNSALAGTRAGFTGLGELVTRCHVITGKKQGQSLNTQFIHTRAHTRAHTPAHPCVHSLGKGSAMVGTH